jgi:hypothetical protein
MVYYLIQQVMIHLPPPQFHRVSNDAVHKVLIYEGKALCLTSSKLLTPQPPSS